MVIGKLFLGLQNHSAAIVRSKVSSVSYVQRFILHNERTSNAIMF